MLHSSRLRVGIMLCGLCVSSQASATRYYVDVDATGADDGTSWADAFNDLEDAISAAGVGDEIWVAEGTYVPSAQVDPGDVTSTTGDARDAAFIVRRGASIYGGFDGTESTLGGRAGLFSTTILSGDIGTGGVDTDNSYRVMIFAPRDEGSSASTTILDGFVIQDGYNDDAGGFSAGAGMLARQSQVLASDAQDLFINNCTFRDNYSDAHGGGLANLAARVTATDSVFVDNVADDHGGGAWSFDPRRSWFIRCAFSGNDAGAGGALSADNQDGGSMVDCVFSGNSAGGGGAIFYNGTAAGSKRMEIRNCLFYENTATTGNGGALSTTGGSTIGQITLTPSDVNIWHTTFADNDSGAVGGAVYGGGAGAHEADLTYDNCIFWGNEATTSDDQYNVGTDAYCCIEGGGSGTGTISSDPRFIDAGNDNYRVEASSPTIDAGSNSLVPTDALDQDGDANTGEDLPYDIDQEDRRFDAPIADTGSGTAPIVDMGPYEVSCVADMDRDMVLNIDDVDAFTDAYNANETAADLNGDGNWDMDDIDEFTDSFNSGCGY